MDGYIVTLPDVEDTEGAQQAVANLKRAVLGFEARRKSDPSKVRAQPMHSQCPLKCYPVIHNPVKYNSIEFPVIIYPLILPYDP